MTPNTPPPPSNTMKTVSIRGSKVSLQINVDEDISVKELKSRIRVAANGELNDSDFELKYKTKLLQDQTPLSTLTNSHKVYLLLLKTRQNVAADTGKRKRCLTKTCNFFGDPLTNGFCSACYRASISLDTTNTTIPVESTETATTKPTMIVLQTDFSRCWKCNRSLGLIAIKCNCGYSFCAKHRLFTKHQCEYDYKTRAKVILGERNENAVVTKIQKI